MNMCGRMQGDSRRGVSQSDSSLFSLDLGYLVLGSQCAME